MKKLFAALALGCSSYIASAGLALAQEYYLSEVRAFAATYCPVGWLPADGRLLPIQENEPLFALFGTVYGGDGRQTFALPNLTGRTPVGVKTASSVGETETGALAAPSPGGERQLGTVALNWCIAVARGYYPSPR